MRALRRTDIRAVKGVQPMAGTPSGFGTADLQSVRIAVRRANESVDRTATGTARG
ncbi:hypothetical protein TNCT6_74190 [Streptomyces sp. 6-11-2]|nr:hypothetical protein TNCT6_74190 [Streptomyces sp. 6-11-2]